MQLLFSLLQIALTFSAGMVYPSPVFVVLLVAGGVCSALTANIVYQKTLDYVKRKESRERA